MTENRKRVPDFFGRLYPDDLQRGSFLGTWVRRAEVDELLDEIQQLRSTLSLAEEGLANYAQEIASLRNDLTACQLERDGLKHDIERLMATASTEVTESNRLQVALSDLHAQVERFCAEQGEWEFYTGPALRALGRSEHDVHERDLQKLVESARSAEPQSALLCTNCGKPLDDHGGVGLPCPT